MWPLGAGLAIKRKIKSDKIDKIVKRKNLILLPPKISKSKDDSE